MMCTWSGGDEILVILDPFGLPRALADRPGPLLARPGQGVPGLGDQLSYIPRRGPARPPPGPFEALLASPEALPEAWETSPGDLPQAACCDLGPPTTPVVRRSQSRPPAPAVSPSPRPT